MTGLTDGLDTKMEALRAAIGKTGAEPYRPSVPTSNLAFFNCATPGFGPWVPYRDFWHKIDDLNFQTCGRPGRRPAPISINPNGSATETKII